MVAVELLIITTSEFGGQDFVEHSNAMLAKVDSRTLVSRA